MAGMGDRPSPLHERTDSFQMEVEQQERENNTDVYGSSAGLSARKMHVWMKAYLPSAAFCGFQAAWAVQIGYVSATLRELGISNHSLSYAWLAGPLTGILVQPVVGSLSDACQSSLGRRRPWVLAGSLLTIAGLMGFSNAESLGQWLGDRPSDTHIGLALAIVFNFVLDAALNMGQGPLRALLVDTVESSHLALGNAFFAANNGVGKLLGYGFGSACLVGIAGFGWLGTEVRALFFIMAVVIFCTTAVTCIFVKERPWRPTLLASLSAAAVSPKNVHGRGFVHGEGEVGAAGVSVGVGGGRAAVEAERRSASSSSSISCVSLVKDLWSCLRLAPLPAKRAFVVQFWAYWAWFFCFIYGATWVGEDVFGGDPNDRQVSAGTGCGETTVFMDGVKHANQGYLAMAFVSIGWSMVLPMLCRCGGVRLVWSLHLSLFGVILCSVPLVQEGDKNTVTALLALTGLPLAATYQIPWSILTASISPAASDSERGKISTLFNLSQCLPEVVVSLIGGVIIHASSGSQQWALFTGGAGAFIGALCCMALVIEPPSLYNRHSEFSDTYGYGGHSGEASTGHASRFPSITHGGRA